MESQVVPGAFVGRAAELARLEAALAAAAAGRGGAVLVAGEAGIGKTRLVGELAERARRGGATVLRGRCIDLVGTGLPYLPLVEALRPLRGSPALGDHAGALGELAWLVPERWPPRAAAPAPAGAEATDAQLRLFEAALAVLDRLGAGERPLLLVLEDLHWADASTLDLVAFLAHAVPGRRILLVGTYRSDEPRPHDPLPRVVGELRRARAATVLELGPLAGDELVLLVARLAGGDAAALADAVRARSEGNPFFAEELVAAALAGERLPRALHELLLRRVAQLDAETRTVLRVAAAAGRDVPYRLLAAVVDLPEPRLLAALQQAVEHGVLVPDQPAGAYRFRHALLAEAVYATLLPGEREAVHGRLARALAEAAAPGAAAGELAQHWAAAGRPVEALAASVRAARDAEAVAGQAEALRHLERALALWERVPDAEALVGLERVAALAWAAELAFRTGDAAGAAALVRRAIALLEVNAEPVRVALLHERLGSYLFPAGDRDGGLAAFRRAVELVPDAPPSAERARVLAALGHGLMLLLRHADSRAVCEQAIAVARAAGDDRPAIRALTVLGVDLCNLGHPRKAVRLLLEVRRRAPELGGSATDLLRAYVCLSDVLITAGRPRRAAAIALKGLELARRLGFERGVGNVLAVNAAEPLLALGDWDRAEEVLARALRVGGPFWAHFPHLRRAQLAIGRGDSEAARHHLEAGSQGAREPQAATLYACLTAELALWEGRPLATVVAVEGAVGGLAPSQIGAQAAQACAFGLRASAELAQLAAVRRDADAVGDAQRRARRLLRTARHGSASPSPDAAAWLAVAEAEHDRVQGRAGAARWRVAVAAWNGLERPYPAAYCRWRLAEVLVAEGRPAEAVDAARQAHRTAARLGALPLQRELELLARRARLDLVGLQPEDAGGPPPAAAGLGLTARERQVLQLLARGYTNRQVAAELVISTKTASVHVSHILRKLGVASRLEAAALAQRLLGPTWP